MHLFREMKLIFYGEKVDSIFTEGSAYETISISDIVCDGREILPLWTSIFD